MRAGGYASVGLAGLRVKQRAKPSIDVTDRFSKIDLLNKLSLRTVPVQQSRKRI